MTSTRSIPALLLLALSAACAEAPTEAISPDGAVPRALVVPACVEFGPPPAVGASWGGPAGTIPGNTVLVENGVRVYTNRFFLSGGGTAYNLMRIEPGFGGFGSGPQIARSNNINIGFSYGGVGFVPTMVSFDWVDLGGVENLIVNGSPVFIGELDTPPAVLGGASVSTVSGPFLGGDRGTTTLTVPAGSSITRFEVGGQEFWIDRVCAWP
jgi:hypothetical protein